MVACDLFEFFFVDDFFFGSVAEKEGDVVFCLVMDEFEEHGAEGCDPGSGCDEDDVARGWFESEVAEGSGHGEGVAFFEGKEDVRADAVFNAFDAEVEQGVLIGRGCDGECAFDNGAVVGEMKVEPLSCFERDSLVIVQLHVNAAHRRGEGVDLGNFS